MSVQAPDNPTALRRCLLKFQQNHSVRLAPDGRQIAYVRNVGDGSELRLLRGGSDNLLGAFHNSTLSDIRWTPDGEIVMFRRAKHGTETWQLTGVRVRDLRQLPAYHAIAGDYWISKLDPVVVYAARESAATRPALWRLDLADPANSPVQVAANPGFHRWLVDRDLRPRGGIRLAIDGSAEIIMGDDLDSARSVLRISADALADFLPLKFSEDGTRLFVLSSIGGATRRLLALTVSGDATTIFDHPYLDLDSYPVAPEGVWFDPVSGEPDICAVMDQRLRYHFLGPVASRAAECLSSTADHTRVLVDRSADDQTWLIAEIHANGPMCYHLHQPATRASGPVLTNRPELTEARLSDLEDFCFKTSDGLLISGYAMRPLYGMAPYPTVLLIHGGPAGRDTWRFNAEAQYLATLGFLSLHVNYRGSRGFGTAFRLAGNGEWGGLMQRDLYEAVSHGIELGLVDPSRISFMGASYGGYAALLAACARPDLAHCAVAISPPCDLVSFTTTPPKYWSSLAGSLRRQLTCRADGQVIDDATLMGRSPAHVVSSSCAPVLIAHGTRDPRVPVADVDSFVRSATDLGVTVKYLRFPDEGHLVKSDLNRQTLFAEIQTFLGRHCAIDR